ncbi:MAG: histidine--tRNA ligase [Bacteroidota bacterium]|nr:histidine--tRNA ligase [Bacteroidota bacterium]
MTKPSLPQGTRDFGPDTVRKRRFIFDTIRGVFELYGFQPLETPAMENLDTLLGKYGEEGDKLIFKILNNGLGDPRNIDKARAAFDRVLQGRNDKDLTERALKYDLTIPFARYVAMNHGQLVLPFKRYQIQPVWRADRPQKGRYREFYQCDADVVGSDSLWNEVELAGVYGDAYSKLGLDVEIRVNSRKLLAALAGFCGGESHLTDITVAIDKLDKIGPDKVKEELAGRGLRNSQVAIIEKYLSISGPNTVILGQVSELFGNDPAAQQGIGELHWLLEHAPAPLVVDLTLARGLNYYTGAIFEVKAKNVQMGSIGGGGRYDDLTGLFGVPGIPGVGISFGVDRIYDVMEELGLFPDEVDQGTQVLFFNLGEAEAAASYALIRQLRQKGVRCELYHEQAKFEKQFRYAEKKKVPYVAILGSKELAEDACQVKDIRNGKQSTVPASELMNMNFM